MIVVTGFDAPVIGAIAARLVRDGRSIDTADPDALDLATLLRADRPKIVAVDELARPGQATSGHWQLGRVVRLAAAGSVAKLVMITSRPADDPELIALRQSGVPYELIGVPLLIELGAEIADRLTCAPRVIVPPELTEVCLRAVERTAVVTAAIAGLDRPGAGHAVEVGGEVDVAAMLADRGAKTATGTLKSWWWRLLGRPRVVIEGGRFALTGQPQPPPTAIASPYPTGGPW